MDFDLRTPDAAYKYLLDFMQMSGEEYIDEYVLECGCDYEAFWGRNFDHINSVDISNLRFIAFHVVGSVDDCAEIRNSGLKNLQKVLSTDTELKRVLAENGVSFDIENRILDYNGRQFNIDYDYYCNNGILSSTEEKIAAVAHRIYYDFCIDGFMLNDNIFSYGTDIHKRPEFLLKLVGLFPELVVIEDMWENRSKSYKVNFFAIFDQIHRFTFELDDNDDPPFDGWDELTDAQKIKKWTLFYSIHRASDDLGEKYLYIKDSCDIPPEQIISCEVITEQ